VSVLVTGATGFIGRDVVRRLLAAGRAVVAFARGGSTVPASERVSAALGGVPPGTDLEVVESDLTLPECGLAREDWRRLRATVETVLHCAGDTRFEPVAMTPYVAGHVRGPVCLLQGLAGGRLAHWAHLSTAFVCGRRSGTIFESEGDVGQAFNNTYERVKLEAERAIRSAGLHLGVDVRVFRPSIVVGAAPATTGGNPSNLFFAFIRMLTTLAQVADSARLRIAAAPRARFNIVPIESVATALLSLAERADAAGATVHLVVRDAPTQEAILRMITEHLGVRGVSLVDARVDPLKDPSHFERVVARALEPYRPYLTQDLCFDDATATRLLARCGVEPLTLSADVVSRLIDQALVVEDTEPEAVSRAAH
jgi:thioester reductase-like protein